MESETTGSTIAGDEGDGPFWPAGNEEGGAAVDEGGDAVFVWERGERERRVVYGDGCSASQQLDENRVELGRGVICLDFEVRGEE